VSTSSEYSSRLSSGPLQQGVTPRPIDLQVSYRYGVPLIYVGGELGHDSSQPLREAIDQELSNHSKVLLLEFSELVYMDSGGLSLLFDTGKRLGDGGWLGIVNPNHNVRRLAEMTSLFERRGFRLIEDLGSVPAALAESPDWFGD